MAKSLLQQLKEKVQKNLEYVVDDNLRQLDIIAELLKKFIKDGNLNSSLNKED